MLLNWKNNLLNCKLKITIPALRFREFPRQIRGIDSRSMLYLASRFPNHNHQVLKINKNKNKIKKLTNCLEPMLFFSAIVSIMYQATVSESPNPALMITGKKKKCLVKRINTKWQSVIVINLYQNLPCVMPPLTDALSPKMHNLLT